VDWSVKAPVTGHGVAADAGATPIVIGVDAAGGVSGETNGIDDGGSGLRPGLAISVDPKGIPAPLPSVGAADIVATPVSIEAQGLADVPAMPPPSNVEVDAAFVPVVVQPVLADGAGLMPGAASSVAPRGMPTGPTRVLEPIASGVALSGDGALATWARAQPQPSRPAVSTPANKLVFMVCSPVRLNGPAGAVDKPLASAPLPCGTRW
jgi:hypothetical protein